MSNISKKVQVQNQVQVEVEVGSEQFQETSCPLKYEEEVILRPKSACACACCNENTNSETNSYEIMFDFRPKFKDIYRGIEREMCLCFIDLCDHHYNKIIDDNNGKLPILIGNDCWDALDGLSN